MIPRSKSTGSADPFLLASWWLHCGRFWAPARDIPARLLHIRPQNWIRKQPKIGPSKRCPKRASHKEPKMIPILRVLKEAIIRANRTQSTKWAHQREGLNGAKRGPEDSHSYHIGIPFPPTTCPSFSTSHDLMHGLTSSQELFTPVHN
jgi:hypothetical protein